MDRGEGRDLTATAKVKAASKVQDVAESTPVGSYCVSGTNTPNAELQLRKVLKSNISVVKYYYYYLL